MIFIPTTSTTVYRRAFQRKSNATVTFIDGRHRDCRLIPPAADEFRRIAGSGYGGERPHPTRHSGVGTEMKSIPKV